MKPNATPEEQDAGSLRVEFRIHFSRGTKGRLRLREARTRTANAVNPIEGAAPGPREARSGPLPRITLLLVLGHRIEAMIRAGQFRDLADAARTIGVSRARATQITNLTLLKPGIQERILDSGGIDRRSLLSERGIRRSTAQPVWSAQDSLILENPIPARPSRSGSKRQVEMPPHIGNILPAMKNTLFTLGYEKRTIAEFLNILTQAQIDILVDVRETPWSHKPGFSKNSLATFLHGVGIRYVHARFAGNPKSIRSTAPTSAACLSLYRQYLHENCQVLKTFAALVHPLLLEGKRVCITCYERDPGDCHRGVLAERWARESGGQITHLVPSGCDRPTLKG